MTAAPNPYAYLQPFAVWENAFTPAELDAIVAHGDGLKLDKAGVIYDPAQATDDSSHRIEAALVTRTVRVRLNHNRMLQLAASA